MQKQEIEGIIAKYRKLVNASRDDDEIYQYERFANYVEENFNLFEEDDYYETEKDLITDFKEAELEIDAQWESMFPEGDDDDSITDFLTR